MPDPGTDTRNDTLSSTHPSPLDFSAAEHMKMHLQHLLGSKEKQLQQVVSLGQRILAQQKDMQERIKPIQDAMEGERGAEEIRELYRQLVDAQLVWEEENARSSIDFGSGAERSLGTSPILRDCGLLPRKEPDPEGTKPAMKTAGTGATSSSSAAQSRRPKKAAKRADDVEFAFEIGNGLLTEIRRLSSLLGERDKSIKDMKEEKKDHERIVESLTTTIRQNDKMIEDLQASLRNLQSTLSDSQTSNQRLESEIKCLTKQELCSVCDASDSLKTEYEELQNITEESEPKMKHEVHAVCDWEWL